MSFTKNTITSYSKYEKDIIFINENIQKIRDLKKTVVDPRAVQIKQKPIWNLESYTQLAIHRVFDLAEQCTIAWENGVPAVSFLLVRAIYENAAYMYDLSHKIKKYYDDENFSEIHNLVVNRLVGNRLGPDHLQIVNVLTVIDKVAEQIPDFKEYYEFISDFCHPNYSAMHGIYGKTDKKHLRFYVGNEYGISDLTFSFIKTGLITGMGIFYNSVKSIIDNIDELNDFFYKHQPLTSE